MGRLLSARTDEDGSQAQGNRRTRFHECCLGLAHAPILAEPSDAAFLFVEPVDETIVFAANDEALAPVGIRDGPHRTRGPPPPRLTPEPAPHIGLRRVSFVIRGESHVVRSRGHGHRLRRPRAHPGTRPRAGCATRRDQSPARAGSRPCRCRRITVSAGRGSDLQKLDVSTTVMTREQIQATPETGVDQLVNRIPGVWLPTIPTGQLHPTAQPVNIRGFGTSTTINTLIMVDGVPVNDPYFRTMNWSTIPKNSVERIEVIRGGGATASGATWPWAASSTSITREPTATSVSADTSYGSYNSSTAEAAGSYVINDKVKVGRSYNHAQSSGYNLTPAQYRNANLVATASKADNIAASVFVTPNDRAEAVRQGLLEQTTRTGWSGPMPTTTGRPIVCSPGKLQIRREPVAELQWLGERGSFGTINVASGAYNLNNIKRDQPICQPDRGGAQLRHRRLDLLRGQFRSAARRQGRRRRASDDGDRLQQPLR